MSITRTEEEDLQQEEEEEDYEPSEEELDAARERALDWEYQEVFDEHGNSYRPFVRGGQ